MSDGGGRDNVRGAERSTENGVRNGNKEGRSNRGLDDSVKVEEGA